MRIPFKYKTTFLKIGKLKFTIQFQKRFKSTNNFVPLGCNCHPAHMLDALNFRHVSLPFDWLLTNPISGLSYVTDNIKNEFKYFTADLKLNEYSKAYSIHYSYSCFFHHSDIVNSNDLKAKFEKRCKKFLHTIKNNSCDFLYVLEASSVNSVKQLNEFQDSVIEFYKLMKQTDRLYIYINFAEEINENKDFINNLITKLTSLKNVRVAKFLLEVNKYGLWGYENNYSILFASFGIKLKARLPHIKFSIENIDNSN